MRSEAKYSLAECRHCQYAGSWYDADGKHLKTELDDWLREAGAHLQKESKESETVLAVIAPHAGYAYSGQTAAYSYAAAATAKPKRVFILGPSHHAPLHGVALPSALSYETPIGNLTVDKQLVEELSSCPLFSFQPHIQCLEHSLELQLPFIKETFGEVTILPLIVGQLASESDVRLVAAVLKGHLRQNDLVVVSSDFTHYGPRYGYTPFGKQFVPRVEQLDKQALALLSKLDVRDFLHFQQETHATICGLYPCAVLAAMLPPSASGKLLRYTTSLSLVPEDKENSVSYLAVSFSGPLWAGGAPAAASVPVDLTAKEKHNLLMLARKAVEHYVRTGKTIDAAQAGVELTPALRERRGSFVTLFKRSAGEESSYRRVHVGKELRGCIGHIYPVLPLYQSVIENAVNACSRDYRFLPVQSEELKELVYEISVLSDPRRVDSYGTIVLGKDGIIISKNNKQAVFLPSVATDFGWNLSQTLQQLCLKAGLQADDWQKGAKFDLFRSLSIDETELDK